jgi:hypothetical protein
LSTMSSITDRAKWSLSKSNSRTPSSAGNNRSQLVGADDCHPVPAPVRTVHIDDRGGYQ